MAKIANVRFSWLKSVSTDVVKTTLTLTTNGSDTVVELPSSQEEFVVEIPANTAFLLTATTTDRSGKTFTVTYADSIDDLVPPQPVTNITHEILSVREVPDA